ncbi:MAG: AraC family transcriptional regulator [Clostridia bacterium]|nr:AraC family transcriptional regulator [Clostridia bacterium]
MQIRYENRSSDFYYRDRTNGGSRLQCKPHLHYHIELVYMLEGTTLAFADSTQYCLEAGDVFVTFPNQMHYFISSGPERYILFILSPDLMPELSRCFTEQLPETALCKHADTNPRLLQMLKIAAGEEENNSPWRDTIIRGALLTFFGELLQMMALTENKAGSSHALRSVVNYCSRNFHRELSLGMLEEELHISKYYISHLFSDRLGIRFNDYVNSLRISAACRLLRHTDDSITEISEQVGFGTLRTFNRAFSKQIGMSPSLYRRTAMTDLITASVP